VAGGLVFGLALSVASTVVLLRALQERHLLDTDHGRIAVGWLIVEDLAMVLTLVLLPALADAIVGAESAGGLRAVLAPLAVTLAKVAAFVALMLMVGRRLLPWLLHRVAGSGSRELFTLAVLALALGIAFGSAELFGVSFALGAFFAGMVLAESELSHRAAEDSLPLRDAFAVLFFVSVGMLFDPVVLVEMPLAVLATYLIIVLGKSAAAFAIVRLFGHSRGTALTVSASLAQIGEFSFILATLGLSLGMLQPEAQDLILAGAILSIITNPLLFSALDRVLPRVTEAPAAAPAEAATPEVVPAAPAARTDDRTPMASRQTGHAIVAGYGFVGRCLAEDLKALGRPFLVIDDRQNSMERLREAGVETIVGNAADAGVLKAANVAQAGWLMVALPNVFEAGQVLAKARRSNPAIRTCARAETEAEAEHLRNNGADEVVIGRREIANGMIDHAFRRVRPLPHPDGPQEMDLDASGDGEPA
jgi:CPA2 family monovalent cation:H+ antiporter-2